VRQCICYWKGEQLGRAAEGRASGARPAGGGSQRRKTKGWGPRVIEGEGRAGPSRPGGEGPKGVGGVERWPADGQGPGGWAET
jgi:hypothetical protein